MKQTYETGLQGEKTAEEFLSEKYGMLCLERRYKTKCGEIDLIMMDGETVVFVEVKTRSGRAEPGNGLAAVNVAKQKRILKAALLYLMQINGMNRPVRFDLVEIHDAEILYVPNAFQPYGKYYH